MYSGQKSRGRIVCKFSVTSTNKLILIIEIIYSIIKIFNLNTTP